MICLQGWWHLGNTQQNFILKYNVQIELYISFYTTLYVQTIQNSSCKYVFTNLHFQSCTCVQTHICTHTDCSLTAMAAFISTIWTICRIITKLMIWYTGQSTRTPILVRQTLELIHLVAWNVNIHAYLSSSSCIHTMPQVNRMQLKAVTVLVVNFIRFSLY